MKTAKAPRCDYCKGVGLKLIVAAEITWITCPKCDGTKKLPQ